MSRLLCAMACLLITSAPVAIGAERIALRAPSAGAPTVELFVAVPKSGAQHPAILYVHGHQNEPRIGGRDMADNGALDRIASRDGYVAASVSQPGYGGSDGPPDYCGPATQQAIRTALAYLRTLPEVDPRRLVLYGVSRGAIAAGVAAADEPDLKGLILDAGIYDFAAAYPALPRGIQRNVEREAGTSPEAFSARSALRVADRISAATLILHGRRDEIAPAAQAETLAGALAARGADVTLALFDSGHFIPFADRRTAVKPFLVRIIEGR